MADQGPDINTSVSQESAVSGVSPKPPVSPEQEAARAEATGLREAEKREGPGEALQNLAGERDTSNYTANQLPDVLNAPDDQAGGTKDANENIRNLDEEIKQKREAAKARLKELEGWTKDQLQDEVDDLRYKSERYQAYLTSPAGRAESEERKKALQDKIEEMDDHRADIRKILAERQQKTAEQQKLDELRGRIRSSVEQAAGMGTMSTEDLKAAAVKYKSSSEILTTSLAAERAKAAPNQDLINALEQEQNDANARATEAQRLFEQKDKETKAKEAEDETKRLDDEVEQVRREAASPSALRASIKDYDREISDLERKIDRAKKDLAKATTDDEKEQARKTLLDLEKQELKAREGKSKDEKALEAAEEKKRKESGLKGKFGLDTVRKMSKEEFLALDEDEQTKYLKEVTNAVEPPQKQKFELIKAAIERGVSVGIEDRALFAKQVSADLIKDGRKGYDMAKLAELSVQFPDVYNTIVDRFVQHESKQKALKEMFPSNWDKIWKFAKDHPSWFIALLLMLAAVPVAAVGVPTVAMASGKVLSKGLV